MVSRRSRGESAHRARAGAPADLMHKFLTEWARWATAPRVYDEVLIFERRNRHSGYRQRMGAFARCAGALGRMHGTDRPVELQAIARTSPEGKR